MTTIWKFPLDIADEQHIKAPGVFTGRHVAMQNGQLCLWGEVMPETNMCAIEVFVRGTGHPIPKGAQYIGSAFDGPFVWHVFVGLILPLVDSVVG